MALDRPEIPLHTTLLALDLGVSWRELRLDFRECGQGETTRFGP
jgi:hypothetical protein